MRSSLGFLTLLPTSKYYKFCMFILNSSLNQLYECNYLVIITKQLQLFLTGWLFDNTLNSIFFIIRDLHVKCGLDFKNDQRYYQYRQPQLVICYLCLLKNRKVRVTIICVQQHTLKITVVVRKILQWSERE